MISGKYFYYKTDAVFLKKNKEMNLSLYSERRFQIYTLKLVCFLKKKILQNIIKTPFVHL